MDEDKDWTTLKWFIIGMLCFPIILILLSPLVGLSDATLKEECLANGGTSVEQPAGKFVKCLW